MLTPWPVQYCQAKMKSISFIVERKGIRKMLLHLKLWPEWDIHGSLNLPVKRIPASVLAKEEKCYEPVDDGWPGYEEPNYEGD